MRVCCYLLLLAAGVIVLPQTCEAQQALSIASEIPAGNQVGEAAGKTPNHEAAIVHQWKQYSKAFEYADYPEIAKHFTYPATLIDASGQAVPAEDQDALMKRFREIRQNVQEGYKYSLLDTFQFHRYSDQVCMVDATFGRFNDSYQRIYTGRCLYFYRNTSDGWRMFATMVLPKE